MQIFIAFRRHALNKYNYADFIDICNVKNDPEEFFGYIVKAEGIWMVPPDHTRWRSMTNSDRRAIYAQFRAHEDFSKPVLRFPCAHALLEDFLNKSYLVGMVSPDSSFFDGVSRQIIDQMHNEARYYRNDIYSSQSTKNKEWFTLEEAAGILRATNKEAVLKMVFEEKDGVTLTASYFFQVPWNGMIYEKIYFKSLLKNLKSFGCQIILYNNRRSLPKGAGVVNYMINQGRYVWHRPPVYKTNKIEVLLYGLVDILFFGECRDSEGDLKLDCYESLSKIYINDPARPNYPRISLLPTKIDGVLFNSLTIKETDLVISRQSLRLYAQQRGKTDIMKLLADKPFISSTEEQTQSLRLPADDGKELVPFQSSPPFRTQSMYQAYTLNQVASFLKTTAEDVFNTINGYKLDPKSNEKIAIIDPCSGKTTLLYPSIVINEHESTFVQCITVFGKRKSGLPCSVLQDVLLQPPCISRATEIQHVKASVYRYYPPKNFVAVQERVSGLCLIGNRLEWNKNGWARVTSLTPQDQDRSGGAVVGLFSVHRDDLVISYVSLDHYREETGIRAKFPHDEPIQAESRQQKNIDTKIPSNNKGGAPQGPLSEAVEHVYLKFKKEGNTEILRRGKIKEFMERLKELADEKGNVNFSTYVADRIEKVKISPAGNTVTTKEQIVKTGKKRETIIKAGTYSQQRVSRLLLDLRKENPLPS